MNSSSQSGAQESVVLQFELAAFGKASFRSPALSPAGRGISLEDPSLRLKSGSAQDDDI
jgi:hypothetical protein